MKKDPAERLEEIHTSGVDWKNRTIWIVGLLTEDKALQYIPALRLMDETKGTITVIVSSRGGDESGGFAIFDTLRGLKNQVVTVGYGAIYSIAALIFQAGSTRAMSPNADLMMHNGSIQMEAGDVATDSIQKIAAEAARNNSRYYCAIAHRSKIQLEDIQAWCVQERYFSAAEAVDAGLADMVLQTADTEVYRGRTFGDRPILR